jgi:hypothetical protein
MMGINLGDYPDRDERGHFFFGKGEIIQEGVQAFENHSFHSFHVARFISHKTNFRPKIK